MSYVNQKLQFSDELLEMPIVYPSK